VICCSGFEIFYVYVKMSICCSKAYANRIWLVYVSEMIFSFWGDGLIVWWGHLSLFLLLQKSYETKQYKKGIKAADAILKKFPDHGGIHFFGNSFLCFSIDSVDIKAC
jgi:hypothetical protein